MYSPSDLFGSLISDTEHLFDEIQNHRSMDKNVHGSPTPSPSFSPIPKFRSGSVRVKDGQSTSKELSQTRNTVETSKPLLNNASR